MPPIPGMVHWHSLLARHAKSLKTAWARASRALDAQLAGRSQAQLEPIFVRNSNRQPIHKLARIRQHQSRWYSTAPEATVRHFSTTGTRSGPKFDRASLPKSRVSAQISQSSGRAPFASTLRPSLTGGTLGRTAGGYTLGSGRIGGARHFSHGPASQAQVVQNVSQAVRAFFISGQKAQFDGVSPTTGEKRYKAVTSLQDENGRKIRSIPQITPGSWVDFPINPTITALTPLTPLAGLTGFSSGSEEPVDHLNTDGLINVLSVDFSRALKDLAVVLNDLKRLSALGDLPITYQGSSLRVHFPGCDSDTVERMCTELNITRGTVTQDEAFDAFAGTEIALLFPFAPSEGVSECESLFDYGPAIENQSPFIHLEDMLTPSESVEEYSTHSDSGLEDVLAEDPWLSDPSGFESIRSGSDHSDKGNPLEYQGLEGIYRFLEQCDAVRR